MLPNEPLFTFRPTLRKGLIWHGALVLGLALSSGFSLWFALKQQVGSYFVLLLLLSLVLALPLTLIIYRGYALLQAGYTLERDGLRLRWGLRAEDIPLPEIEWVRPVSDLPYALPRPALAMPGALLGLVNSPDLGPVEYMASDDQSLLLVATSRRVYVISPADARSFVSAFQRVIEMGSLSPIPPATTLPAAYLQSVWANRPARGLMISGVALTLILFVLVSLLIPTRATIALGFDPHGALVDPVPAEQLLLLPVLGAFVCLTDVLIGLYYYRHIPFRPLAFLMWVGGVITPLLLLVGVAFIV